MISWKSIIAIAVLSLGVMEGVLGHVSMSTPPARGARSNRSYPVDYNLEAPLNSPALPGDFPCRHSRPGPANVSYNAGGSIHVEFNIINSHKGGHCQFSISYDNQNFVVLKTVFGSCFNGARSYDVPVPRGARGGTATFGWSWVNAEGNREFYMNCADIHINGPSDGSITGQQMMVANLPNTPYIDQWIYGRGTDGYQYYKQCPVMTIPQGARPRSDGYTNDWY
ncbi:hypothetical protein BDF19DRAFT_444679 [Syncephalis fuscata]|nr:hypothetical protein BDF19DRAFT_444679 [Syncephalis fuscata]